MDPGPDSSGLRHPGAASLLALQRTAGNAAVNRLMRTRSVQRLVEEVPDGSSAPTGKTAITAEIHFRSGVTTLSLMCDAGDTVANLIEFVRPRLAKAFFPAFEVRGQDGVLRTDDALGTGTYRVMVTSRDWADISDSDNDSEDEQPVQVRNPRFTLRLPTGFTFDVTCDSGNDVAALKQFIAAQTLADPSTVQVFIGSAPLGDETELADGAAYRTAYTNLNWADVAEEEDLQRERDRLRAEFRLPETVEQVLAHAHYVDQDNPELAEVLGEESSGLYFIGRELAYTYNLKTCTAITLYCGQSELAFLDHIDASADVDRIAGQIGEFLTKLKQEREADDQTIMNDLTVRIYHAIGEYEQEGSYTNAVESLRKAGVTADVVPVEVSGTELVVVGGGEQPESFETGDVHLHDRIALRAYINGDYGYHVLGKPLYEYLNRNWSYAQRYRELHSLLDVAIDVAESRQDRELAEVFFLGLPEPTGVRLIGGG
ncbi:hypothetical protein JOF56_000264 [Kibdelosporangium banguiense]|uniref:Uncharacterized protein n=1 Tax=Kibdelosporangium banguiense TaxID=1365924 RepID=A0ABS4T5Y2_9PSEU|nr:hypothetical protein [Kibdelosporangium banguiense]MBP2319879.1 hypothetical protein [Kibdelosporangium banguiense]